MLMEVRNQIKISYLSIKYAMMKEMINKASFLSNIVFMVLNNSSFIIQWLILFSLKESIGGYSFEQVMLLWGLAAGTYGVAHFFFKNAFDLSEIIQTGKLDAYLVQPKNVLIQIITTDVSVAALGDLVYALIIVVIFGFRIIPLFVLFSITGGFIAVSISIIFSSLAFWFQRTEMLTDTMNGIILNFATYPDGIFKGFVKIILFTIVPVGIANYLPVHIMTNFDIKLFLIVIVVTILLILFAFFIFNKGLKRYSSSNLMNARI